MMVGEGRTSSFLFYSFVLCETSWETGKKNRDPGWGARTIQRARDLLRGASQLSLPTRPVAAYQRFQPAETLQLFPRANPGSGEAIYLRVLAGSISSKALNLWPRSMR